MTINLLFCLAFATLCFEHVAQTWAKKNVLLIMADDMRAEAEPYRNHWGFSVAPDELHTPNLVDLAANGTTFLKAYCQVPLCGPR